MESLLNNLSYKNFKVNIWLVISGMCFWILNIRFVSFNRILATSISALIAGILLVVMSFFNFNAAAKAKEAHIKIKVLSMFAAFSCCLVNYRCYIEAYSKGVFSGFINTDIFFIIFLIIISLFSFYFCYILSILVYKWLAKLFKDAFSSVTKADIVFLSIIALIFIAFTSYAFFKSDAFYKKFNIYSGDVALLIDSNAWLSFEHGENDLRQPLFAAFSIPFVAPLYALSIFSSDTGLVTIILINISQIILLIFTNYLIADMLTDNKFYKICIVALLSATYTTMLFSIMMEQYVVVVFWLMLFIHKYIKGYGDDKDAIALFYAAAGTLVTGGVLFPLLFKKQDLKNIKYCIKRLFLIGIGFVFLCLIFDRATVFIRILTSLNNYLGYTGQDLTYIDRLYQYITFIASCFFTPNAGAEFIVAWQLDEVTAINYMGIIILIISILGFLLNYKDKLCRISFAWIIFSFIILCIIGWGTQENALILYSLYFCWAFFVLIYKFAAKILNKLNIPKLSFIFFAIILITMLYINISGIYDMVNFVITMFPT